MAKYKINKQHEKEVQTYIKTVIKKLSKDNGEILPEWFNSLNLLADNYNVVIKCQKQINDEGITIIDRFGSRVANPAIKIKNDAQIQLQKLNIEFFLTKKSAQKLINNEETEESPLMNFVKGKKEKR